MKDFVILPLIFTVSFNICIWTHQINGMIVIGPGVNITHVYWKAWLKGSGLMENLLPDTTFNDNVRDRRPGSDAAVGRRTLKDIIIQKIIQNYAGIEFVSDDFKNNHQTFHIKDPDVNNLIKEIIERRRNFPNGFIKSMTQPFNGIGNVPNKAGDQRQPKDHPIEKKKTKPSWQEAAAQEAKRNTAIAVTKLKKEHERKVNEIATFLKGRYYSTDYIYEEIQRIQNTRQVRDPLRRMVEYLDLYGSESLKKSVIKCFFDRNEQAKPTANMWNQRPNNLVINFLKDKHNEGVSRK